VSRWASRDGARAAQPNQRMQPTSAWSPVITIAVAVGLVLLVAGSQVRQAYESRRRLMAEGRWPPDKPTSSA
jgi:hypothetical protein